MGISEMGKLGLGLGVGIEDLDLEQGLGIGIKDWNWGFDIWIWDWGFNYPSNAKLRSKLWVLKVNNFYNTTHSDMFHCETV